MNLVFPLSCKSPHRQCKQVVKKISNQYDSLQLLQGFPGFVQKKIQYSSSEQDANLLTATLSYFFAAIISSQNQFAFFSIYFLPSVRLPQQPEMHANTMQTHVRVHSDHGLGFLQLNKCDFYDALRVIEFTCLLKAYTFFQLFFICIALLGHQLVYSKAYTLWYSVNIFISYFFMHCHTTKSTHLFLG